jgi:1-acyl-sn-glycerol-3-phosphate acyltransferase
MMPAIGKVARKSGAKLVTFRVEGGYLTQPRWSKTLRKGKLKGRLMHEYTLEELKSMTDEEVNDAIIRDLYEDAYATQEKERIAFKGKDLALGMETTVFSCPSCKAIGGLTSHGNEVSCTCGFHAVYDVYGMLTDAEGKAYTLTQLDEMQKQVLTEQVATQAEGEPLFFDRVTLHEIDNNHTCTGTREGTLVAYGDHFECCGYTLSFASMQGVAIYSRNSLVLHQEGLDGHLEVKSGDQFSALKYMYLYNMKK